MDMSRFNQFKKFAATGAASAIVYSAIFMLTVSFLPTEKLAWLAVVPAFVAATTFGYFVNSIWAFRDSASGGLARFVRYMVAQSGGGLLNIGFTWVATSGLGLPPWSALLPAVTLTPLLTFVMARSWVFI